MLIKENLEEFSSGIQLYCEDYENFLVMVNINTEV